MQNIFKNRIGIHRATQGPRQTMPWTIQVLTFHAAMYYFGRGKHTLCLNSKIHFKGNLDYFNIL